MHPKPRPPEPPDRALHAQHDGRTRDDSRPIAHLRADRSIIRVGNGGVQTRPRLDRHIRAQSDEFLHRFRGHGNPRLALRHLAQDGQFQPVCHVGPINGPEENDESRDEHNHRSRHFDDTDETGIGLPGGVEIMHLCHVACILPM
jgi:hypothetical protein